jgi:NADH-quinone oxidoreductase subunit B
MEGLLLLREAAGHERRPLSWIVGPQGTSRAPLPSLRDLKHDDRVAATLLRPQNET